MAVVLATAQQAVTTTATARSVATINQRRQQLKSDCAVAWSTGLGVVLATVPAQRVVNIRLCGSVGNRAGSSVGDSQRQRAVREKSSIQWTE